MVGQFFATIPGERFVKFTRQPLRLFDQRRHNAFGVFVGNLHQHHIPGMPFDECRNIAVLRATDQVPFPMPGHRPILDGCRSFADRYGILDLAKTIAFEAGMLGAADRALGA